MLIFGQKSGRPPLLVVHVFFTNPDRRGEYEARSFLNRITAIDDVAEVQKELSKAEIIKTGIFDKTTYCTYNEN